MNAYTQSNAYQAYQNAANHGRVAASNPHGLILMLMDGAIERIARARGCIENKDFASKAHLLHRSVAIIDELRNSLDRKNGGPLADNLHELYDYMCRELLQGTVDNKVDRLDGVLNLLRQVRDAWIVIPKLQGAGR